MKLTARNYFSRRANMEYLSVSQFKAFEKCQHAALAEITGKYKREATTALLVGQYVDAYFDGELDVFKKNNPQIFTSKGTLKADFLRAEEIISRIMRDKLFKHFMSGERQVIMTGVINGVSVKIKIDSLHSDKIVDGKIMSDFEPIYTPEKGLLPWFEAWGYDLQGGVYQEIVRQNTGKRLPFYLAAATKEKTTDIDIVHIGQSHLDFALERFANHAEEYDAIKKRVIPAERCGKCDYCKNTKKIKAPTEAEEFYFL